MVAPLLHKVGSDYFVVRIEYISRQPTHSAQFSPPRQSVKLVTTHRSFFQGERAVPFQLEKAGSKYRRMIAPFGSFRQAKTVVDLRNCLLDRFEAKYNEQG